MIKVERSCSRTERVYYVCTETLEDDDLFELFVKATEVYDPNTIRAGVALMRDLQHVADHATDGRQIVEDTASSPRPVW